MPLGIDSVVGAGICHTEQDNATSHVHPTSNSVVGAYHHPVSVGVANKA